MRRQQPLSFTDAGLTGPARGRRSAATSLPIHSTRCIKAHSRQLRCADITGALTGSAASAAEASLAAKPHKPRRASLTVVLFGGDRLRSLCSRMDETAAGNATNAQSKREDACLIWRNAARFRPAIHRASAEPSAGGFRNCARTRAQNSVAATPNRPAGGSRAQPAARR